MPARRADFAGGVPAIDHDQAAAIPLAFVGELTAELTPPAIRDHAGQLAVAQHACHVQVFDNNGVRTADQAGAGAVQEISAGIPDLAVRRSYLRRAPGPIPSTLLGGQPAPLAAEPGAWP